MGLEVAVRNLPGASDSRKACLERPGHPLEFRALFARLGAFRVHCWGWRRPSQTFAGRGKASPPRAQHQKMLLGVCLGSLLTGQGARAAALLFLTLSPSLGLKGENHLGVLFIHMDTLEAK